MPPLTKRRTADLLLYRSENTIPDGTHVYRFIDTISHRLKPRGKGKPVVSLGTIRVGLQHLIPALVEHYDGFDVSKQMRLKCDSLLNTLVKEGVLTKGRWRQRQWVGFQTILRMCDTWMQTALQEGCSSWDTKISRQLSILLIAAFASRNGDVTRSMLYRSLECLTFKDITLTFCGGGNTVNDLSMDVVLRFVKGYK